MKKKISYFLCCFSIVFFGCNKYNAMEDEELSIVTSYTVKPSFTSALVGGVARFGTNNTPAMIGICYAKTPNPTIKDSVARCKVSNGSYSLEMEKLETGVTYFIKAFATKLSGETIYGNEMSFTTKSIEIDYWRSYNRLYYRSDYNDSLVICVEGEKWKMYGSKFTYTAVALKMVARNNKNDFFYPKVEIQSDSLLNFKIPDDLLGSNPYVLNKKYYLLVNNAPFRNFRSTLKSLNDKLYDGSKDTAFIQIGNKDIHIDQIKLWPVPIGRNPCNTYDIHGEFGGYSFNEADPMRRTYHGVLNCPVSQTLLVKVNGVVNSYPVANDFNKINTGSNCGDVIALYVIRDSNTYYHDPVLIRIITNFPYNQPITFQVENTMSDGTVYRSNEYTFTNPQTTTPCTL